MSTTNAWESPNTFGQIVLHRASPVDAAALQRILSAAGIQCRLVPDADGVLVLVEETDAPIAEIFLAKRKKNVEDEEEPDDEEEEEDDVEDEEEDEDEDFDDDEEDEDEFEEEFDDDELDDDDDDIFYDDDDDE